MRLWLLLLFLTGAPGRALCQLPPGCVDLAASALSDTDPMTIFPENRELEDVAPPRRWGAWREERAAPTHHYAINQAKAGGDPPVKLEPYTMYMDNQGVSYDAYSLDRWYDPARTDEMLQQTPSEVDKPWNKITGLGTNMRQVSTGPDGNVFGTTYTGRSGVRVGIRGSADPVWEDFTEMSANFGFRTSDGGSMEALLTRGSALLTHRFTDADPQLTPFCLSSVNGQPASYQCPQEGGYVDGGEGFIEGSCTDDTLHITLYTTKPVPIELVQYAAAPRSQWPAGMVTCGPECRMSEDGKRVDIDVPGADGNMAFAVNVISRFILPPDWTNNPETATCNLRRDSPVLGDSPATGGATSCGQDFCQTPECEFDGSSNSFTLVLEVTEPLAELGLVQVAATESAAWAGGAFPPMITCTEETCSLEDGGTRVVWSGTFSSPSVAYAINLIGRAVYPPGDWTNDPYRYTCGDEVTTADPGVTGGPSPTPPPGPEPSPDPAYCADTPASSETCTSSFCQHSFCQENGVDAAYQDVKIIMRFDEPLAGIADVQMAVSNTWDWTGAMEGCTGSHCSLSGDGRTLTYCRAMPQGGVAFAVNVIGRFIRPTSDWQAAPYQLQCGGTGEDLGVGRKFVLELDEPGTALPGQTRRYAAYFSSDVRATLDAGGIAFSTPDGDAPFTGVMQLGYLGSGPRGDTSNDDFYDAYQGVFPYNAQMGMCVQDDTGYLNFNWNKNDVNGATDDGDLLMIAYPHQWDLLEAAGFTLIDTPFGFRGAVGDQWLLTEDELPHAHMEPIDAAVESIRQNQTQLDDVLSALDRDAAAQPIDDTCDRGGSYWAGKDIGFAARTASISRAFGTDHYEEIDDAIGRCLDRWLRVDDTLDGADRFWYDTVMGGLFSRCVPDNEPVVPYANFGFPIYADHHFHLGYWVYAAAYYARHHEDWAQERRERLLLLARDIGNPSSAADPWFPAVRHKDWFLGFSWATGAHGGSRQEESSTESINAYHGLAALGDALGHSQLEAVGRLMLATEVRSVREYFHVRPHNRERFPSYIQQYGAIGMFTDESFSYTLNWPCAPNLFPMRHACLIGIQVIPILSVSRYYMDYDWADSVRTVCEWSVDPWSAPGIELIDPDLVEPVGEGWGPLCLAAAAPYSAGLTERAAAAVRGAGPGAVVSGTGEAGMLLWLYGRS